MEWTAEQCERAFEQTMVWGNIAFYVLLAWIIFLAIWWFLDIIAKGRYLENLSEEELIIVSKYNKVSFFNYKRKVKKVKKDEHN